MNAVVPALVIPWRRGLAACAAAALLSVSVPALSAQILVTTGGDQNNFADGCSLREAIVNAETDSKNGSPECAKGSGADEIILLPDVMGLSSSLLEESDPAVGDLDITTDITLLGGGQQFSIIDAGKNGRIFDVRPGGKLTMSGVLLRNGRADDLNVGSQPSGGAIRVAGPDGVLPAAILSAVDIGVIESVSEDLIVDAVTDSGAGIYAGPGTQVSITRAQFIRNETLGTSGHGAGIYCDGCTLTVESATFANNKARRGAGAYLAAGSNSDLSYVTLGFNDAQNAAGIYNEGALSYFASISADNAAGMAGDDLTCSGASTFTGQYSFAEYPQGCTPMTGVRTRADLPVNTEPMVLWELSNQRFVNQPSAVLPISRGAIGDTVPAAQCVGHRDQLGTPGVHTPLPGYPAPASSDPGCSSGSYEAPIAAVGIMASSAQAPSYTSVQLAIGVLGTLGADAQMHFQVRGAGGIGESCDLSSVAPVTIPQSTSGASVTINAALLFPSLSLDRRQRVCEFEGVLVSPESIYNGATTGVLRIRFNDGIADVGDAISAPAAGTYLNIGTVAPTVGGNASIYFKASGDPLRIDSVSITGADPSEFSVVTDLSSPLMTNLTPGASVPLTIHCNGSALGDYDAILNVNATRSISNTPEPLIYGLRCRVAHLVSFVSSPNLGVMSEADPRDFRITARLDSPNVTATPILIDMYEGGGSATPDRGLPLGVVGDFVPFVPALGAPLQLSIPPGAQEAYVDIDVIDDMTFSEPIESILVRAELPEARTDVAFASGNVSDLIGLQIVDNDVPAVGAAVMISGMPTHVQPGTQVPVNVIAENTSNLASFSNTHVRLDAGAPVQVLSYLVAEVEISCEAHKQFLIELHKNDLPDPVAAQAAALAAEPCTNGTRVSSLADTDGDGINDQVPVSSAIAMATDTFCTIESNTRIGDCLFRAGLPPGAKVRVKAIVQVAVMSAPELDYLAHMTATVSGTGSGATSSMGENEVSFIIDGHEGAESGALGGAMLVLVSLLALRGRRKGPLVG